MAYATQTEVSAERSQAQIKSLVTKYGATQYMTADCIEDGKALVQFQLRNRYVRFQLRLPSPQDEQFHKTAKGKPRDASVAYKAWEQSCRSSWRSLHLIIKAKLESIESGIAVFEEEFMAHIVMPNGVTLGETAIPQIAKAYETGKMPTSLLALPAPTEDSDD